MKRILRNMIVLLFVVGLLGSCSKHNKDTPKPDNKTLIVGFWQYADQSTYFQADGSTKRILVEKKEFNNHFEFTADNKVLIDGTPQNTYEINNTSLKIMDGSEIEIDAIITKLDAHDFVFETKFESSTPYEGQYGSGYLVHTFHRSAE